MTGAGFTHLDESGAARMVDVSGKDVTVRVATATGRVDLSAECVALLRSGGVPKGDALAVARVAGARRRTRQEEVPPTTLTRGVAGTVAKTFVLNLPGSTGAVKDAAQVLAPVIGHLVAQLRGSGDHG